MTGALHSASGHVLRRAHVPFAAASLSLVIVAAVASGGCGNGPSEHIATIAAALSANDKTAYDYFIDQGLSAVQAAGIIGNLDVESGMDPTAVESGGPGRGIAQWSAGGRWDTTPSDNVVDYAKMKGEDHLSLQLQLEFIWYELTTFPGYGLVKLRAASTVSVAVSAFESGFEGCAACDPSTRVIDAQKALDAYGADVPSDGGTSTQGGDGATMTCVVTPTGASGECLATSACNALGDHMSTPGYCPGVADNQCCTASASASSGDSGSSAPSPGGNLGAGSNETSDSGGGCSVTSSRAQDTSAPVLLVLAALAVKRRRAHR
jgi:MYXO-CTERM domain-containing protein